MPVPSAVTDLSTIIGSNYPLGSESPSLVDDYFRAHAKFIRDLYDWQTNYQTRVIYSNTRGIPGDGTDALALTDAATLELYNAGGGVLVMTPPTSRYAYSRAPLARNGVTILVPNEATRMVITGTKWPLYSCILLGGVNGANYVRCPTHNLNNVTNGDESVTCTTAGDAALYADGDVVAVETVSTYTVGSDTVPTWLQLNVVSGTPSAGVIGLRRPIQKTQSSVRIRRLSRTGLTMLNADTTDSGLTLEAVRDFHLIGGTWETTVSGGPFMGMGGAIDCTIAPAIVKAATGVAYGNLFAHCAISAKSERVYRYGGELAWGAHNNRVNIGSTTFYDGGLASSWYFGLSEGARDNLIDIGSIHGGKLSVTNPIAITNSFRNTIRIGALGGLTTSGSTVLIQTLAYVGTYPNSDDNEIRVGVANMGSQLRYVQTTANAARNRVFGDFTGTATSDAISLSGTDTEVDGWFANGAVSLGGSESNNRVRGRVGSDRSIGTDYTGAFRNDIVVDTSNYRTFAATAFRLSPNTYTSASGLTKTQTIAAGTLTTGDTYKLSLRGVKAGTAGNATISVTFAGTSLVSSVFSTASVYELDIIIVVQSNTVATASVCSKVGTTVTPADVGVTGKDFAANPYDLVVSVSLASVGDSFSMRYCANQPIRTQTDGKLA